MLESALLRAHKSSHVIVAHFNHKIVEAKNEVKHRSRP